MCVCLRLIVGYAVLIRLACVCVYVYIYEERECVCEERVCVRARGSQGRRELQAAADTELVTEQVCNSQNLIVQGLGQERPLLLASQLQRHPPVSL